MAQLKTRILLLNGTQGKWEELQGYVLAKGEPAVEFIPTAPTEENPSAKVEAVKIKIGDGFTAYANLPYVGDEISSALEESFNAKLDEITAAMSTMGNAVFQVNAADLADVEGDSEGAKLKNYITEDVNEGNIAIVTKVIAGDVVSRTAYAYTENGVWAALDGNYDAKDIYFSKDLTYTSDIGALKLPEGATSSTYEATGKSLEALISRLMAETIAPTITQPKYTLDSTSAKYATNTVKTSATATSSDNTEIGNYITAAEWKGTFTDGTYSFGYEGGTGTADTKAGCTASYEVSCDKAGTASGQTEDGTWTFTNQIQIDSTSAKTYATITNKCTWSDSTRTPINNIGDAVDGIIETNTDSPASASKAVSVTGHRSSFYYVGTDNESTIDNAFIRNAFSRKANTVDFGVDTKTPGGNTFKGVIIPAGTKRVMFAVPGTYNNIAVVNVDGMNLPEDGFTRTEVDVEGANGYTATTYSVFTKENANGMSATGFTVTISK